MSLFITFEGLEGSGKSTQARLLYERLQIRGYPVILTREPGGTRIGEMIRRILVDLKHTEMAPTTETLLFSAARAQLISELIRPYLATGGIVLCDRYSDSTYAYQGYGLGRDLDELHAITKAATGDLMPDLTLYLDLTAEEGLERKRLAARVNRGEQLMTPSSPSSSNNAQQEPAWNRLDARDLEYHQRVATGFQELIQRDPQRWRKIDARLPVHEVAHLVELEVEPLLAQITLLEQDS
ncbi:MAG: dTMP kinase [Chloroflexales bacterium]|nr:dTMP kinase [Chloroflexales bacterium]